jgi:hypothetical protein
MSLPLDAKILIGCTSILLIGESIALVVGMHLLSTSDNSWISVKNDLFLLIDLGIGIGLITSFFVDINVSLLILIIGISCLMHGYRTWEYIIETPSAFCINLALFTVNMAKLAGLLLCCILLLVHRTI